MCFDARNNTVVYASHLYDGVVARRFNGPGSLTYLHDVKLGENIVDVVTGSPEYIYAIGLSGQLWKVNVTEPGAMTVVNGSDADPGSTDCSSLAVYGEYIYACCSQLGAGGISIFDSTPNLLKTVPNPMKCHGLAVDASRKLLYTAGSKVEVYSLADPVNIVPLAFHEITPGTPYDIQIEDDLVFVAAVQVWLYFKVDPMDPGGLIEVGRHACLTGLSCVGIAAAPPFVFTTDYSNSQFRVYDTAKTPIQLIQTVPLMSNGKEGIEVYEGYLYVAGNQNGLRIYDMLFTDAPATPAPPTPLPPTPAPPTPAPPTPAPPTLGPTLIPPTPSPETPAPLTLPPLTLAPPTLAPLTAFPATSAPLTQAPPTVTPTAAPPTQVPMSTAHPVVAIVRTQMPQQVTTQAPERENLTMEVVVNSPEVCVFGQKNHLHHPSPLQQILEERTEATKKGASVAALASAAGMASAGGAMRLALMADLCHTGPGQSTQSGLPVALHPTQWSPWGTPMAGVVMGNALICAGAAFTSVLLICAFRLPSRFKNTDILGLLRVPSIPLYVFQFLYQGLSMGAFNLIIRGSGWEIAGGVAGVLLCCAVPVWVYHVVRRDVPRLARYETYPQRGLTVSLFMGEGEWASTTDVMWVPRYASMVRSYREGAVWYSAVEFTFSLALSAIKSVPTDDSTQCGHLQVAAVVVFTAYGVVLVYLWPYARQRDCVAEVVTLGSQTTALSFMAVAYYGDGGLWLFEVASMLFLLTAGVLVMKSLCDIAGEVYRIFFEKPQVSYSDEGLVELGEVHTSLSTDSSQTEKIHWGESWEDSYYTPRRAALQLLLGDDGKMEPDNSVLV